MRTRLLPFAALLFLSAPTSAQLHAGEVPNGSNALDLNIDIVLNTSFTSDSASLELDCDDSMDAWAVLVQGAPPIDAPNVAMLHFVDDDLEVCMEFAPNPFQQRPQYYAFDQLLDCAGDFDWQSTDQLVLGDFGGFTAIGPITIDSLYIAYRRGAQVGWMLLSIDVLGNLPVRLQVHQVLPICPGTMSVASYEGSPTVALFPNPSNGQPVRVESPDALHNIEVLDATGRSVAQYSGAVRTIAAPEIAGTYFVRATHADGRRSVTHLVRY
ncbi:MAG: T9SS type A sorting domain-containing protein [Flavobacteriales bacterium]|nr:T9SS type A sorting domain-containing protein [Flavobacteriales bacterium]